MTKKSVYNDTNVNNQRMNLNNGDNQNNFSAMHAGYQHSTNDSKYLLLFFAVILF